MHIDAHSSFHEDGHLLGKFVYSLHRALTSCLIKQQDIFPCIRKFDSPINNGTATSGLIEWSQSTASCYTAYKLRVSGDRFCHNSYCVATVLVLI